MIIRQLRVPGNRLTAFLVFVLTTIFFMSLRYLPCLGGWNEAGLRVQSWLPVTLPSPWLSPMRFDGTHSHLKYILCLFFFCWSALTFSIMTRVASGHVLSATMAEGEVVTGQDIYAQGHDPNFNWQNEATNRLTVVGRGNRFWVYTNGNLIGEIDPSAPPPQPNLPPEPEKPVDTSNAEAMADYLQQQAEYEIVVEQINADFRARRRALQNADTTFERGFIALVALSQSGRKTVCKFDNAWLWLIE